MSDDSRIFQAMQAWSGARMAIATVVSTWGSAPRPRGSHMLVHEDGRFEGSVSGGCVETDLLTVAADVIADGHQRLQRYGVAREAAWEVGLPCGGDIEVLVQIVGPEGFPPALGAAVLAARQTGTAALVETELSTGMSRLVAQSAAPADDVFLNMYLPPRRLLVVGAVQIAQALCEISHTLGIETVVIDPRARFLTEERFPHALRDDRWPDEAVRAWKPGPTTAVVTLSHDIKLDDPALVEALAAPTGYVAALGSTRSHAARRARLGSLGLDAAALDRIEGPAGVAIGARSSAEIALSIAGGLVRALVDADPTRKQVLRGQEENPVYGALLHGS